MAYHLQRDRSQDIKSKAVKEKDESIQKSSEVTPARRRTRFAKKLRERRGEGGFDLLLLLIIVALSLFGSVMIASASYANAAVRYGDAYYFIKRQALWLFCGLLVMLLAGTAALLIKTIRK